MRRSSAHPVFGSLPHISTLGDEPANCPTCGPVTRLTTGWCFEDEEPSILRCALCDEPLFRC